MRTRSLTAAAVTALCALAVAVPAASADSIAYVKDGDVHLATSDGSRTFRVTDRGGYSDVSQADDGTLIALSGVRLHRLDRTGNVLADFDTPVSGVPGNSSGFTGPLNPAVSPDGQKVAYTYFWNSTTQDPSCMPPTCYVSIREGGTGYTWADRQTSWDDPQLGKHSGWLFPAWIDDDNLMLSFPTHAFNYDVIQDKLSDGDSGNLVREWFSDTVDSNPAMGAGDITRDRRKLAFQTGAGDSTLTVYHVPNFPTTWRDGRAFDNERPTVCYRYSGPAGGRFSQPSFSPDGAGVAYADGDGVHVAAVPGFENGCSTDGATNTPPVVIPGGSEPDWGPADVPADRPKDDPPKHDGPIDPVRPAALTASVRGTKLATALRRGLRLSVNVPADGRLSAAAKSGARTVAKAPAKQVRAGARSITLRFTKAAKRALRRKRSVRLQVTVKAAGRTATLAARLRR